MFNAFASDPNRPEHILKTQAGGAQASDRRSTGRQHPYDRRSGGGRDGFRNGGGRRNSGAGQGDDRRKSGPARSSAGHFQDPRQIKSYVDLDGATGGGEVALNYD
jgi:hypothetical protein